MPGGLDILIMNWKLWVQIPPGGRPFFSLFVVFQLCCNTADFSCKNNMMCSLGRTKPYITVLEKTLPIKCQWVDQDNLNARFSSKGLSASERHQKLNPSIEFRQPSCLRMEKRIQRIQRIRFRSNGWSPTFPKKFQFLWSCFFFLTWTSCYQCQLGFFSFSSISDFHLKCLG